MNFVTGNLFCKCWSVLEQCRCHLTLKTAGGSKALPDGLCPARGVSSGSYRRASFTPELLGEIKLKGVKLANVLLHVGLGTFRPVQVEDITNHQMHEEFFEMTPESAGIINDARQKGGRVIAVGTTSVRCLETSSNNEGIVIPGSGMTDIFIYPGYKYKLVEGLITNFHLPKSTLLMLVSAFAGRERMLEAYRLAVAERYRFFSFGDAMFII
ncbi:hypothetical protein N752_04420 [Desulforamulus aquiferis]|nr:hypothetical protein N752_04420 [Desulforamulus aquiferis]